MIATRGKDEYAGLRGEAKEKRRGVFRSGPALPPLLILLVIAAVGCGDDAPQIREDPDAGVVDMSFPDPVFSGNRTLDTLFSVDFDDDGRREYVVTSIEDGKTVPVNGRADRLEIYRFDTATGAWNVVLTDTLLWTTRYDLQELTGDRASELVVETFGGGNDPTASQGMMIYSGHGRQIRRLLEVPDGAPTVRRIEGMTQPVILVRSEYWPEFVPHFRSTTYVSDLLSLTEGKVESVRGKNLPFFRKEAEERMENYRRMLQEATVVDTEEIGGIEELEGNDLYVAAAETIIALNEAQDRDGLRSFWHVQQDTLRRLLSQEEFDVLDQLYADRIMK